MSDSSQVRLARIAEVTEGTTPATPTFKIMRFTGEGLKPNISFASSNEIRADGNVPDLEPVGSAAGGKVDFELSYGSFDDELESLLRSTWATNVLKNGVTPKALTYEKLFEAGATDQYHRFTGCRVNKMDLSVRANEIVRGSFEIMGRGYSVAQAAIASSSYTAANTNPIINAANNFASLTMSGVTSPQITGLDLSITGNNRHQPVVGSIASKGVGQGRFMVTGSLDAYFETNDLYDLFLNGTGSNLSFSLGGASSLKYDFSMGNIKFTDGEVLTPGNDQDTMARMAFQAIYYASDTASLKITRTP